MTLRIDLHVFMHNDPAEREQLDRIESALAQLTQRSIAMSAELDTLTAEVTENTTVVDSAIVLIGGLADQIRALSTDPAALLALANTLDSKTNELAAAVAANTPTP